MKTVIKFKKEINKAGNKLVLVSKKEKGSEAIPGACIVIKLGSAGKNNESNLCITENG